MASGDSKSKPYDEKYSAEVTLAQRFMVMCGVALVMAGAAAMLYGLSRIVSLRERVEEAAKLAKDLDSPAWAFVLTNSEVVMFFVTGVVSILLGINLMRRAIAATAQTISDKDRALLEPLISGGEEQAIGQYVRLASLSGVTGFFTKLGFTGLPLATAGLGVLLLFMAMLQGSGSEAEKQLLDLAKLVIGAFIGSFVQRQVASDGANKPETTL